jgi:mannose-6-phosphate isomerase-like protein (cupin superfamily)
MTQALTSILPVDADVIAPDGCEVRILVQTPRGSMAHFTLGPRQVSRAVAHRTVEELWFFLSGKGRMWRRLGEREDTAEVTAGVSVSIPLGTHFQLRNDADEPLAAVAVTMPPWPGDDEAYLVEGKWPANVGG